MTKKEVKRRIAAPVKFRYGEDSGLDRDASTKRMGQYLEQLNESVQSSVKNSQKKS
jgi:hypothetical protein